MPGASLRVKIRFSIFGGFSNSSACKGSRSASKDPRMSAAGNDATFKSRLVALGVESTPMTTAQFEKFVTDEIAKWAKVVKFASIKAD